MLCYRLLIPEVPRIFELGFELVASIFRGIEVSYTTGKGRFYDDRLNFNWRFPSRETIVLNFSTDQSRDKNRLPGRRLVRRV